MTTITTNPVPTDRRYTDVHSWLGRAIPRIVKL